MKIIRENAMRLWFQRYGFAAYARDFNGGLMYRDAYGKRNFFVWENGQKIYCGWNLHHILPLAHGGTDDEDNLVCTNIITNDEAEDKITYWIDGTLYQVRKIHGAQKYTIVKLNEGEVRKCKDLFGIRRAVTNYSQSQIIWL